MEMTDSLPKQQAVDGKGAFAGNPEPDPEQGDVGEPATQAGISPPPEVPLDVKETLEKRDQDRWELNSDSAQH
ncbi:MAG: DUF6335 family protein [Cyanobacteria bacterium P01_A01_bin.37]